MSPTSSRGRRPSPDVRPTGRGWLWAPGFLTVEDRSAIESWLSTLHPLWEQRFSPHRKLPAGESHRALLRPVYWLGNWQFACLGYYSPPRGVVDRAVRAEPFPPVLARIVAEVERRVRKGFVAEDVPKDWSLNTCLVNFYGDRLVDDKWVDVARVGEHRDIEPGPVASLSIGERARFQFVKRGRVGGPPVRTLWLDDGDILAFGGPVWHDALLHRVQRVEDKLGLSLPPEISGFRTRRVNFTFRYVPEEHIVSYARMGEDARRDVQGYVAELGRFSGFWRDEGGRP